MRLFVVLLTVTGCVDEIDARWELDHDRVVAVRATPPRIMPDQEAALETLVAHAGAPVAVEQARSVSAPTAPAALQSMVSFDGSRWLVRAPSDETLASSRPAMGLAADAPVPLDLLLVFGAPGHELYVTKTVWLGDLAENPALPAITFDGASAGESLAIPLGRDVYVEAATGLRVNWLTSCGTLFQDDVARAFLRADEACTGELAMVVRDANGGVTWRVWSLSAG
jgi:hypothetical protein